MDSALPLSEIFQLHTRFCRKLRVTPNFENPLLPLHNFFVFFYRYVHPWYLKYDDCYFSCVLKLRQKNKRACLTTISRIFVRIVRQLNCV